MNPLLRHSAAHVFVDSLTEPELAPDDVHHLRRVLRLRDGCSLSVSDGAGQWMPATLCGDRIEPQGEPMAAAATPAVTVAAAIPKGDRLDWMVQKLTEIGVAEIRLLDCERSVVRWETERVERHLARLDRIAREAAAQSRRVTLPAVVAPVPAGEMIAAGFAVSDPSGVPLAEVATRAVLVGPEGGWAPVEWAAIVGPTVRLPGGVLRVESAALVAAVLMMAREY